MTRHQSRKSSDLIRLQCQGYLVPWGSSVEFEGNVSVPGPQPRCQELSARNIALEHDAKRWHLARSVKSWDALRAHKPLGSSVRGTGPKIRSECRSL